MRNLKHELWVGFPKTVLARYVNCSLNMKATSNYGRLFMFHFTLFVCLFYNNNIDDFFIFFILLTVNMKVSKLIPLFPVIEIPIIAHKLFIYLFIYLFRFYFSYSSSKKWDYIGYLHREEIFKNIFNCKYILSLFTFLFNCKYILSLFTFFILLFYLFIRLFIF